MSSIRAWGPEAEGLALRLDALVHDALDDAFLNRQPGVDLDDSAGLLELMESPPAADRR